MPRSKFHIWCEKYGLDTVRRLAEEGLSDKEIPSRAHMTQAEFNSWKRRFRAFRDAIEIGRREADFSVTEALYKKAIGYNVSLNKTHKLKRVDYDPDTGKKLREYEELATGVDEDYIEPDLRAEIFWLKNRLPERWSERGALSCDDESIGGVVEIPVADTIDGRDSVSEPPLVK